jgi:hypothetical protein
VANPSQTDTDYAADVAALGRGFGNRCDGDFDNDDLVSALDTAALLAAVGGSDPLYDLEEPPDGSVDGDDVLIFNSELFGLPPGPSVGSGSAICLPEPGASLQWISGLAALALLRRRARSRSLSRGGDRSAPA